MGTARCGQGKSAVDYFASERGRTCYIWQGGSTGGSHRNDRFNCWGAAGERKAVGPSDQTPMQSFIMPWNGDGRRVHAMWGGHGLSHLHSRHVIVQAYYGWYEVWRASSAVLRYMCTDFQCTNSVRSYQSALARGSHGGGRGGAPWSRGRPAGN